MSFASQQDEGADLQPIRQQEIIRSLRAIVNELLPDGRPTIARVAPRLGMSVRTLQRRLQRSGCTFEEVLDGIRRDVAIEELSNGTGSITETAFLLGYSDLSHFTRAFRRWTDMAPREFTAAAKGKKGISPPMDKEGSRTEDDR